MLNIDGSTQVYVWLRINKTSMTSNKNQVFLKSVIEGLSSKKKRLSSRYFYDNEGSRIFKQIMLMPEYYLTDSEFEILQNKSDEIFQLFDFKVPYSIVELGAGDGEKTIQLLKYLMNQDVAFEYTPIDISAEAIDMLSMNMATALPELEINPLVGDYFHMLSELKTKEKPMVILFLGSNIGNFPLPDAENFLQQVANSMNPGDKLVLGVDLQKNPHVIKKAYDDDSGYTRSFNLNLLQRINRELEGDFDLENWDFYSLYDPSAGEVRSYLISLKDQTVRIRAANKAFHFQRNELIYTELSRKYSLEEIEVLGTSASLQLIDHVMDTNQYFSDSIFVK